MSDLPKNIIMDNETTNPSFGCPACMCYFSDTDENPENYHEPGQTYDFNCPKCNTHLIVNRCVNKRLYYTTKTADVENTFLEVDDFLDEFIIPSKKNVGVRYAQFVLEFMRAPAAKQYNVNQWTKQFKLFTTYKGGRYRITGASRMGDVWLAKDENKDTGYDLRVCIKDCFEFSPEKIFYYNELGDLTGYSTSVIEGWSYVN